MLPMNISQQWASGKGKRKIAFDPFANPGIGSRLDLNSIGSS
jgi:hypothetical protein